MFRHQRIALPKKLGVAQRLRDVGNGVSTESGSDRVIIVVQNPVATAPGTDLILRRYRPPGTDTTVARVRSSLVC